MTTEVSEVVPTELDVEESTSLVYHPEGVATELAPNAILTYEAFESIVKVCDHLIKTGFIPPEIMTPEQGAAIVLTGRELGLGMMQSLRTVYIVRGKPSLKAEMMLGLFQARGGRIEWLITTPECARARFIKKNGDEHVEEFTTKMAWTEKIITTSTKPDSSWLLRPWLMNQYRCISRAGRIFFPECTGGLYTPEERSEFETDDERDQRISLEVSRKFAPVKGRELPTKEQRKFFERLIQNVKLSDDQRKHNEKWIAQPGVSRQQVAERIQHLTITIELQAAGLTEVVEESDGEEQAEQKPQPCKHGVPPNVSCVECEIDKDQAPKEGGGGDE